MNVYFIPISKYCHITTPNYEIGNAKHNMNYYRQSYCSPENLEITRPKLEFAVLEVVNTTRKFNNIYVEFIGYITRDKLT